MDGQNTNLDESLSIICSPFILMVQNLMAVYPKKRKKKNTCEHCRLLIIFGSSMYSIMKSSPFLITAFLFSLLSYDYLISENFCWIILAIYPYSS